MTFRPPHANGAAMVPLEGQEDTMNTDTAIPTHTMSQRRRHMADRCQYEAFRHGLNLNAYLEAKGIQPSKLYRLSLNRLVDLHILLTSQFSPVPMLDDCEPEYELEMDDVGPFDDYDWVLLEDEDDHEAPVWPTLDDEIPF